MKPTTNFFGTAVWAMVGAIAILSPISEQLDERLCSFFFALRGTQSPPPEIVILAIDGESLSAGETSLKSKLGTWPWKRAAYAEAIEQILNAGAKVVALDILLTSPSVHGVADDARFQQTLERFGDRLVLAASYEDSQNSQAVISQLISPAQNFRLPNAAIGLVKYRANSLNEISHLNNNLANDQGSDRPNFLSFAAATLKAAKIPISETKGNRINYAGRDNTWLYAGQQKPFFYVLDPQNWQILAQQKFFQNKIVVIGATAPSLQDFQTSPLGRMSGVEINVNAIATLLRNSGIQTGITDNGLKVLLILGLIGATGLIFERLRRPLPQFLGALIISLLIGMASYTTFIYGKISMPTVIPLATVGLNGLTLLVVGTVSIQRERSALRRTLEQYVAAPIVNEILSQPGDFRRLLRGKNVRAAVLFCDIRGFTALSTQLPADQLISQLNTYLEKMVDAILAAQGTVDKFIGDAIMAEFGSPLSQGEKEDAMNAIRAALQMRSHLVELRSQWHKSGNVPFFNGIGIHYGEITVGNIGSPKRLEYAAIGDTVNLASRVEGMTKVFGVDILITEALYRIVREEVTVIAFGEHTVKGRSQTVNLYALVDLKGNDDTLFAQVRTQTQNYLPNHNNL